ncbi:hypothetical protein ABZ341_37265 [Streptomyces sp. NPDC006173]|uniref:hypothetical protein n=1 Tax=Streptomyces sp. NPDC006173 TaxID=3155349 RepID=UPI0034018CF5
MGEATLLLLGAVFGYFGHVGQARYTHKQQQKADDVAQAKSLHSGFIKLRDLGEERREAMKLTAALESEVVLLRNAKLRRRVLLDLGYIRDLSVAAKDPGHARKVWTQDIVDCLAATARGDRLPAPEEAYDTQLFLVNRRVMRLAPALAPIFAAIAASPEVAALAEERAAWERRRRARAGWRRVLFWNQ